MEATMMREILLALAQTGINLTPKAFRMLMTNPQPKEILNQIVINYFTSKFARKTLSDEDLDIILKNTSQSGGKLTQLKSADSQILPPQDEERTQPVTIKNGHILPPLTQDSQTTPQIVSQSQIIHSSNPTEIEVLPLSTPSTPSDIPLISGLEDNVEPAMSSTTFKPHVPSFKYELGGVKSWKPLAREYPPDVKVISDPTKDLYTNGEIDDFIKLFVNRYEKMRKIFQQRRDANDAIPISEIKNFKTDQEVKIIGMVVEKRQTKNNNVLIELEDPTGRIMALVSQNKPELFALIPNLMLDQVIYVSGLLRIGDGRSRIIMVEDFFWPDVPLNFRPKHADIRVSAMCISDIHLGSKEFLKPIWDRMVDFLHGRLGNERQCQLASEIKYILIAGDAIDGIGVYPNQEEDLLYDSIHQQYNVLEEILQAIPDYIQIIYIPGNHEPVRNALPMPAVPKKYVGDLQSRLNVLCLGNPAMVALHGVKSLLYHGDSFIDFSMNNSAVSLDHPETAMFECLRGRHLAPSFGKKTEIAPVPVDWLVIDEIPDFIHTGHIHVNGLGKYHNILCIGSGCFESQTEYMKSLNITPTPGRPIIIRLYSPDLQVTQLDLHEI